MEAALGLRRILSGLIRLLFRPDLIFVLEASNSRHRARSASYQLFVDASATRTFISTPIRFPTNSSPKRPRAVLGWLASRLQAETAAASPPAHADDSFSHIAKQVELQLRRTGLSGPNSAVGLRMRARSGIGTRRGLELGYGTGAIGTCCNRHHPSRQSLEQSNRVRRPQSAALRLSTTIYRTGYSAGGGFPAGRQADHILWQWFAVRPACDNFSLRCHSM